MVATPGCACDRRDALVSAECGHNQQWLCSRVKAFSTMGKGGNSVRGTRLVQDFSRGEVAQHASKTDKWIVVDGEWTNRPDASRPCLSPRTVIDSITLAPRASL